jgi:hypothetical protein
VPIVGDDDGQEGDGRAGTEQHAFSAGKKPTLFVQGLFLALLLGSIGVMIYYTSAVRASSVKLLEAMTAFLRREFHPSGSTGSSVAANVGPGTSGVVVSQFLTNGRPLGYALLPNAPQSRSSALYAREHVRQEHGIVGMPAMRAKGLCTILCTSKRAFER